jgi:hypothetical protein
MEKATDDPVAVPVAKAAKERFPRVSSFSYDQGFHSPAKQAGRKGIVDQIVLPRKGKLSEAAQAVESEPEFARLRRQHAAVESAINALEVHGWDDCPDPGIGGFQRSVALAGVRCCASRTQGDTAVQTKKQPDPASKWHRQEGETGAVRLETGADENKSHHLATRGTCAEKSP